MESDIIRGRSYTHEQIDSISSVFDNFGDYMVIYNSEGIILHINDNLLTTLDFSREEIERKKINDILFSWSEENTKEHFDYLNNTDRHVLRCFFTRRSGAQIPVKAKNTLIIYKGNKAILSVSHDISMDLHIEKKEKEKLRILRENLGGVILAMANSVEVRDSYTAGHQQRVSNLARKIAYHMDLTPDQIEGIRIAASIHDIGKIAIPSDILNKSQHLLDIEFELIKHHTNIGFMILSTIDFPWPVAAIILQHHECIDGSGYPLGLEGSMMLTESKVVCVADVVEAMSTHRPYRPALGIDQALQEIKNNRDILYDFRVVDACLQIFEI